MREKEKGNLKIIFYSPTPTPSPTLSPSSPGLAGGVARSRNRRSTFSSAGVRRRALPRHASPHASRSSGTSWRSGEGGAVRGAAVGAVAGAREEEEEEARAEEDALACGWWYSTQFCACAGVVEEGGSAGGVRALDSGSAKLTADVDADGVVYNPKPTGFGGLGLLSLCTTPTPLRIPPPTNTGSVDMEATDAAAGY